jgi:hypothetical protein
VLEAVVRLRVAQDFALAGLLELTPAGISGYLRLLKLRLYPKTARLNRM